MGKLLIAVGGGGGLQLGDIDRGAVGTAVFPGFPRLGRREVGASDLQGLVASPVVVVLPEADKELGELLKVLPGMRVEEPGQGLVTAFVLPLCFRVPGSSGDALASMFGEEDLGASDVPATGLVE